jgi:hypothetical protein
MRTHAHILTMGTPTHTAWWLAMLGAMFLLLAPPSATAAANPYPRNGHATEVFDHRFNHDRSYPARGVSVHELPRAAVPIRFHESPYYFHGGSWYRPYGASFRVIGPPLGVLVPFLPNYYTTVWFGGTPYYYANSVYYQWLPDQREYIVTTPPDESALSTQAPGASTDDEPFIYPKNGQSEQQQATDRYECHRWAADQSQYDPTQPAGSLSADQNAQSRSGYFRAMTACLESRGYSVK